MESSGIFKGKGELTGIEVPLREMSSSEIWQKLTEWNDLSEILVITEERLKADKESCPSDTLVEGMKSIMAQVNEARNEVVFAGYKLILSKLAGPIIDDGREFEPKTDDDLQSIFPLLHGDKLSDLHQIISDYLASQLPDQEVLKNSERE